MATLRLLLLCAATGCGLKPYTDVTGDTPTGTSTEALTSTTSTTTGSTASTTSTASTSDTSDTGVAPPPVLPSYPPQPCETTADCADGYLCLKVSSEPLESYCIIPYDAQAHDCDVWEQDCPDGYKCAFFYGNGLYDAACVPLLGDGGHGDACSEVLPLYAHVYLDSGYFMRPDTCGPDSQCLWDGTCHERCDFDGQTASCPHPLHLCGVSRVAYWCFSYCDPVVQSCPDGEVCAIGNGAPWCLPDASGDEGQLYDPCVEHNECDPGLACLLAEYVGECDPQLSAGCCSPFCQVGDLDPCPGAQQSCIAVYDETWDYPELKHIGVCAIPR